MPKRKVTQLCSNPEVWSRIRDKDNTAQTENMSKAVIPLESNPEIFTQFSHSLGLSTAYQFHDVYSLTDPELLAFIPRPVDAVILLFPVTEAYDKLKQEEEKERKDIKDIVWFKQTVKNACGLFALLNSISNLQDGAFAPQSRFWDFKSANGDVKKVEELIDQLSQHYSDAAHSGSTEAPDANDEINLHFIAFVKKNGHIYELDGGRNGALDLGQGNDSDILGDEILVKRFQKYLELADEQNRLNYSLMALGPSYD